MLPEEQIHSLPSEFSPFFRAPQNADREYSSIFLNGNQADLEKRRNKARSKPFLAGGKNISESS
jgi:hypothetical protein